MKYIQREVKICTYRHGRDSGHNKCGDRRYMYGVYFCACCAIECRYQQKGTLKIKANTTKSKQELIKEIVGLKNELRYIEDLWRKKQNKETFLDQIAHYFKTKSIERNTNNEQ